MVVPMDRKEIVEVLNISRGVDGKTGEPIFIVQFGKTLAKDDARYSQYVRSGAPVPMFNVLTLFYNFDGVAPYRVGTEWEINVDKDGSLKLTEVVK
jgi:hypothetical protein